MVNMFELTVFKNCDNRQPKQFVASEMHIVENKLRQWMDTNNGENGKPCSVDGLTVDDQWVTLIWDECYKNWQIEYEDEDTENFDTWEEARNLFVNSMWQYITLVKGTGMVAFG